MRGLNLGSVYLSKNFAEISKTLTSLTISRASSRRGASSFESMRPKALSRFVLSSRGGAAMGGGEDKYSIRKSVRRFGYTFAARSSAFDALDHEPSLPI